MERIRESVRAVIALPENIEIAYMILNGDVLK